MTDTERIDEHAVVVALSGPLRRVVAARIGDPHLVDDVVQETILRMLDARDRVADVALLPYAVVTARNLVATRGRRDATAERNASRLVDMQAPAGPEESLLRAEEADAVRVALRHLPARERDTLIAHEVHGVDTKSLAESNSSTPGGVAAQLARARARMRVEYVLVLRGVDLPSDSCRSVLLALSIGDQRRQKALDAGSHLLSCATCAELSEPLLARKRVLVGLLPAGVTAWLADMKPPRPSLRAVSQLAAGATVIGVVVAAILVGRPTSEPEPAPNPARPSPAPMLVIGTGEPVVATAALLAAARSDRPVTGRDAAVVAVPADEGFWVANGNGRLWVRLVGSGKSDFVVRPGQRLDFRAEAVRHGQGFARQVGVLGRAAARELDQQGLHLRVPVESLTRS